MSTPSIPSTLPSLYRHLLRTSRSTFQGDQRMLIAWRQFVRQKLPLQASLAANPAAAATAASSSSSASSSSPATSPQLPEEVIKEWLDVAKMLKMNVVQGIKDDKDQVYHLRFTSDTELGTNESIKASREQQLADLKASKGSLACGGNARTSTRPCLSNGTSSFSPSSSSTSPASSSSVSARFFSTSNRSLAPRDPSKIKTHQRFAPVPHPPPHFPSIAILADGSSIQLTSTSPRSAQRLIRDPTNHPLWNPSKDPRAGTGAEDEAGRMDRFRKRFAQVQQESYEAISGLEEVDNSEQQQDANDVSLSEQPDLTPAEAAAAAAGTSSASTGGTSSRSSPASSSSSSSSKKKGMFEMDDLDWMSEGGREVKVAPRFVPVAKGSPAPTKKK